MNQKQPQTSQWVDLLEPTRDKIAIRLSRAAERIREGNGSGNDQLPGEARLCSRELGSIASAVGNGAPLPPLIARLSAASGDLRRRARKRKKDGYRTTATTPDLDQIETAMREIQ